MAGWLRSRQADKEEAHAARSPVTNGEIHDAEKNSIVNNLSHFLRSPHFNQILPLTPL